MRQGHNKRMRGRNRKGPNPLSRSYESNGPDVKVRGTAVHIAEKYVTLARDAASAGDRVAEQNYLQHAEHYFRIVAAAQAQMPPQQQYQRSDDDGDDEDERAQYNGERQGSGENGQPQFGLSDPQPYVNGDAMEQGDDDEEAASPPSQMNGEDGQSASNGNGNGSNGNGSSRPRSRRPRSRPQPSEPAPVAQEVAAEE